jgi:hypothetical protein
LSRKKLRYGKNIFSEKSKKVLALLSVLHYTFRMSATFTSFRAACEFFHEKCPHISYDVICEFVKEKIKTCEIILA